MYTLMAQPKRFGDFAERSARELESAHRPVKLGSGHVSCLRGIDEVALSRLGLVQQVAIQRHASTVSRQKTGVKSAVLPV